MNQEELNNIIKLHEKWLAGDPNGERCDLSFTALAGVNLYGACLFAADLEGANLSWANLELADMRGANLRGANLSGANLSGANLNAANLEEATMVFAKLDGADLHDTVAVGMHSICALTNNLLIGPQIDPQISPYIEPNQYSVENPTMRISYWTQEGECLVTEEVASPVPQTVDELEDVAYELGQWALEGFPYAKNEEMSMILAERWYQTIIEAGDLYARIERQGDSYSVLAYGYSGEMAQYLTREDYENMKYDPETLLFEIKLLKAAELSGWSEYPQTMVAIENIVCECFSETWYDMFSVMDAQQIADLYKLTYFAYQKGCNDEFTNGEG